MTITNRLRVGGNARCDEEQHEQIMKLGPGISFSWKRAFGVTKAKRKIAKATGIPLTPAGRRNKLGKWMGMK